MYSRKKTVEELPHELTVVWTCTADDCKGWMRDDFAFETVPVCRVCQAPMEQSTKMLPLIVNTNRDQKTLKKGISIPEM